jgi:mycothiol synthase
VGRPVRAAGPAIGLVLRPLRPADAPALFELVRLGRAVDEVTEPFTFEELYHHWFDHPGSDPELDSSGAFDADGNLLGFVWVFARDHALSVARVFIAGDVRPDHRRQRLGTLLLRRAEARAGVVLATLGPGLSGEIYVDSPAHSTGREALFTGEGYRVARTFATMRRPLAEPPTAAELASEPAGFTFQNWTEALDDASLAAHNDAFRDHWGSDPVSRERWRHVVRGAPGFSPESSWLGLDGDTVAGYTLTTLTTDQAGQRLGWLGTIGVRRAYRRRGLASALIARSLAGFRAAGVVEAGLDVDLENPSGAPRIYGALGFRVTRRSTIYVKTITPDR